MITQNTVPNTLRVCLIPCSSAKMLRGLKHDLKIMKERHWQAPTETKGNTSPKLPPLRLPPPHEAEPLSLDVLQRTAVLLAPSPPVLFLNSRSVLTPRQTILSTLSRPSRSGFDPGASGKFTSEYCWVPIDLGTSPQVVQNKQNATEDNDSHGNAIGECCPGSVVSTAGRDCSTPLDDGV